MSKTLAYYPGCSLHGTSGEFDASFRATRPGARPHAAGDPRLGVLRQHRGALHQPPARRGPAGQRARQGRAGHEARRRGRALRGVLQPLQDRRPRGRRGRARRRPTCVPSSAAPTTAASRSHNLIDVYHDAVGLEELEAKVTRPFAGLKVACYYGCLLTRPPKVTLADDPEYPTHMDEVVKALGCEPVRLELQDRLLRRRAGAHRAGHRRRPRRPHPHRRQGVRRRGRRRRLPALPGEPGRPAGRDRQEGRRLAAHPGGVPQPARRPRRRRRRQDARPQEAPRRHRGGDGVAAAPPSRPALRAGAGPPGGASLLPGGPAAVVRAPVDPAPALRAAREGDARQEPRRGAERRPFCCVADSPGNACGAAPIAYNGACDRPSDRPGRASGEGARMRPDGSPAADGDAQARPFPAGDAPSAGPTTSTATAYPARVRHAPRLHGRGGGRHRRGAARGGPRGGPARPPRRPAPRATMRSSSAAR